jgi:hypothetical protein
MTKKKKVKPSERIRELRREVAFDMFGIKDGESIHPFVIEQAKGAATQNPHVAIAAIIQYLDEQGDE